MFSHKHQNMYLWKDMAFPHSENTKWLATPVTCCCLTTFSPKIHEIYVCNVPGVSCSVTNERTCISGKILYFRTLKTQSDWQPIGYMAAVALQLVHKEFIFYSNWQLNWSVLFSNKDKNMYLWQETAMPHIEITKCMVKHAQSSWYVYFEQLYFIASAGNTAFIFCQGVDIIPL
jgi:hypothetical protein